MSSIGKVAWFDLTVPDAEKVQDFYSKVTGWKSEPFDMKDYKDYNMQMPGSGETVAGICNARGGNADLPPQWLIYITVENIEESVRLCETNSGRIISPVKQIGNYGKMCVIQDPAGAYAALFEEAK